MQTNKIKIDNLLSRSLNKQLTHRQTIITKNYLMIKVFIFFETIND